MEHKIDVVRLNHTKIRSEIKYLWAGRGVKDGEHDKVKAKIQVDLAKVEQKERITKIIHETYVRELERVKNQISEEQLKAHELKLKQQ